MADSNPLAVLLDRAGDVFSLAGTLGRAFQEEHQQRSGQIDPAGWNRHATVFNQFWESMLDLRESMQNPPIGFSPVAELLMDAARIAKGLRQVIQRLDGQSWETCLDFFPELNSVSENGWLAVKEVTAARWLDDPFSFVDESRGSDETNAALLLLDQFPATLDGHIEFLESVRDEVHYAAEAKQKQLERGYSNATLAQMVGGINWVEAGQRISMLPNLPANTVEQVAVVLRRQLTVGTVEQIDGLFTSAVRTLRDAWEQSQDGESSVIPELEIICDEPPEVIEIQRWLSIDGTKGHWNHTIEAAEVWGLEVDARHRNIAFLLRQAMGGDPPEDAIRDYLFKIHGILPSDETNLAKLEQLLRQDAERVRNVNLDETEANDSNFIERLLAGPNDAELTARELALLESHIKQPLPLSAIQRERRASATNESAFYVRLNKLKLIRDFNRNLLAAHAALPKAESTSKADTAVGRQDSKGEPESQPAVEQAKSGKRRGRKKANYETVQRESQLATNWEQARDAGVYKPNFARDNDMSLDELDRLLDRVAKRKEHSDN